MRSGETGCVCLAVGVCEDSVAEIDIIITNIEVRIKKKNQNKSFMFNSNNINFVFINYQNIPPPTQLLNK